MSVFLVNFSNSVILIKLLITRLHCVPAGSALEALLLRHTLGVRGIPVIMLKYSTFYIFLSLKFFVHLKQIHWRSSDLVGGGSTDREKFGGRFGWLLVIWVGSLTSTLGELDPGPDPTQIRLKSGYWRRIEKPI